MLLKLIQKLVIFSKQMNKNILYNPIKNIFLYYDINIFLYYKIFQYHVFYSTTINYDFWVIILLLL